MSMVSFSSMAQSSKSGKCPAAKDCPTECPAPENGCAPAGKCTPAGCDRPDAFTGLNLTDTQKSQLKQLKANRIQARKEKTQARKADRMRNDSARVAARRADRKQYLEEVKAIIGPDQYVMYLENIVLDTPQGRPGHHGAMRAKADRPRKISGDSSRMVAKHRHGHHAEARADKAVKENKAK